MVTAKKRQYKLVAPHGGKPWGLSYCGADTGCIFSGKFTPCFDCQLPDCRRPVGGIKLK